MPIRTAVLSALVALAFAGGALAEVIRGSVDLTTTGRVVSTGSTSLVVSTDDHGHSIPFLVDTTTVLPPSLAVGDRVTVHYHPVGTTSQIADRVDLLDTPVPARPVADGTGVQAPAPPSAASAPSTGSQREAGTTLPSTASPLPLVGLVGLAALVGGLSLQALERRRS